MVAVKIIVSAGVENLLFLRSESITKLGCKIMDTENEIIFLRTYKDFIYYFNMLERNIGYCLRYCMKSRGNVNSGKWLSASFDSKVKRILRLAKESGVDDKFSAWSSDIEECRHLRNIVTHGNWEWREFLDKPILFHAPEIEEGKGQFTNDEFKSKLTFLIKVSDTFRKIRTPLEAACEKQAQQAPGHLR